MQKIIFALALSLFVYTNAQAQFKIGLKGGMSSTQLNINDLGIYAANDSFTIKVENAHYGYHAGIWMRGQIRHFIIQADVLFNSSKTDYKITNSNQEILNGVLSEKYQTLDIPVLFGWKWGWFRLQGGPVAHVFLDSYSELTNIAGYEQKFKTFTYGAQAGIGVDILDKYTIDLRYEGNFSKYGEHITVDGREYIFDGNPSRLIASLGISF